MTLISMPEDRFTDVPGYDYPVEHISVGEPEMAYVNVPGGRLRQFMHWVCCEGRDADG